MKKPLITILIIMILCFGNTVYAAAEDFPQIGVAEPGVGPEDYTNQYTKIFAVADQIDYNVLRRILFWEAVRADCCYENGQYVLADPEIYHTCPYELYVATIETVLNRVLSDEFPNKIEYVQSGFVHKKLPNIGQDVDELIDDVISDVFDSGLRVLPSTSYTYFATKKQSLAKNHILIGKYKGHRMYFGEPRK